MARENTGMIIIKVHPYFWQLTVQIVGKYKLHFYKISDWCFIMPNLLYLSRIFILFTVRSISAFLLTVYINKYSDKKHKIYALQQLTNKLNFVLKLQTFGLQCYINHTVW